VNSKQYRKLQDVKDTMKNSILFIIICFIAFTATAQKFGYVDSKYILSHVQAYADAQAEIDQMSIDCKKEIEQKYESIEKMEKAYQAEKILLTSEMKKKREEEMEEKRKEARELQKKRFGVEGDLFKKREELIKPIQDEIYKAIQEVASQGGLMVVFDKATNSNILYSNPKHDVSDKVLKKMGLKPGETNDGAEGDEEEKAGDDEKPNASKDKSGSGGKTTGTKPGSANSKRNP
jgi:outer membrane protein